MNAEQLGRRAGAFTGAGVSLASGAGPSSVQDRRELALRGRN